MYLSDQIEAGAGISARVVEVLGFFVLTIAAVADWRLGKACD